MAVIAPDVEIVYPPDTILHMQERKAPEGEVRKLHTSCSCAACALWDRYISEELFEMTDAYCYALLQALGTSGHPLLQALGKSGHMNCAQCAAAYVR